MKWKNSSDGVPSGLLKMLRPDSCSTRLWWICIALPGSPAIGLAMKVAYMSWRSAASRTVRLNKNTSSARLSGSPWKKLISIWPAPISWIRVSTFSSILLAVVVDVLEQRVELVDRVDASRPGGEVSARPRAARSAACSGMSGSVLRATR